MGEIELSAIPFVNLRRQYASIRTEVDRAMQSVVEGCVFASGPAVEAFEEEFARYCHVKHCIAVNSGTSSLHLALIGSGIEPGDEVITVPMTFVSTAWAISYVDAKAVFVDIESGSYTIDPNRVKEAITSRTRALIAVHLYGHMADLDPLWEICQEYDLTLIEDAAQAHGARYHGRIAGGVGQIGCFSFYPSKNLGAFGEGGALTTNDGKIAARARALRDHGQSEKYVHDELGFNYRMDEMQAAVLRVKLRYLDGWNAARKLVAARYEEKLGYLPLGLPKEREGNKHAWHLYVVRHPERNRLQQELTKVTIGTGLHYPIPVHLHPAFAQLGYRAGDFPVAEQHARECLSLPIYAELTEREQDRVAEALHDAIGEA